MKRSWLLVALLFLLAGCSDDGSDAGDGGDGGDGGTDADGDQIAPPEAMSLTVTATGIYPVNPSFSPAEIHLAPGAPVTLTFNNEDPNLVVVHDWVVDGVEGAQTDAIGSGETTSIEFTAPDEPGEYVFYCSVGDHREQGMEGVLHVMAQA